MPDLPGRSGYCATKKEHFYGLRGHLVITLAGTAFTVANVDERDVVPNLYDKVLLIGDKGFISGELKAEAAAHDIDLQTPLRKNMPDDRDPGAVARLMRTRRTPPSVNSRRGSPPRQPRPSKLREPNGQKAPGLQLLSHGCSIVTAQKPENWVIVPFRFRRRCRMRLH
jgi:hypothetical protein